MAFFDANKAKTIEIFLSLSNIALMTESQGCGRFHGAPRWVPGKSSLSGSTKSGIVVACLWCNT
jgi:hypothetical protein